jgi:hypothetical protein
MTTLFTPSGISRLANVLPLLRDRELALRSAAAAKGIEYDFPDYAGLRTPADTVQLIRWRDEAVTIARRDAEAKRKAQGGTAVQIKLAGDVAATRAYYRVSPADASFHGVGSAFDIRIRKVPPGMTTDQAYKALGAIAPSIGLRWGGTFSAPADPFHFELAKSRDDAAILWKSFLASPDAQRATAQTFAIVPALGIAIALFALGSALASSGKS